MPGQGHASCGLQSMRNWSWRSSTMAWASQRRVARVWDSPRCVSGHLSWAVVASSRVPQMAAPGRWSVCHCPRKVPRSEKVGDPANPHRRRPPALPQGHGLPALIGTRFRGSRRGNNRRRGRGACRTTSARCGLDGPADAKGERYRGHAKDPPAEPEREILDLIAQGYPNPSIAKQLSLSTKTVGNYVSNIFTKLQVADRAQAIIRAREAGLG